MAPRKRTTTPSKPSAPRTTAIPASNGHGLKPKDKAPAAPLTDRIVRQVRIVIRVFVLITLVAMGWSKLFGKRQLSQVEQNKAQVMGVSSRLEPIEANVARRDAVLDAFKHSYSAYERDAFGKDHYHPISHKGSDMSLKGPVGYFVIDTLDSLLLMGLDDEFQRAHKWVKDLSFDIDDKLHHFEITIRVLGGLLSAYHMSGNDTVFLERAVDLADRLLPAFDTPTGLPYSFVNLAQRKGIPDPDNRGWTSIAEAGTLQLEMRYLSELTGNPIYWQKAEKVIDIIRKLKSKDGLVPIFVSPQSGDFVMSEIRLGSRGDSYYEYLLKQYLQTNRVDRVFKDMHDKAMSGIKRHLLKTSVTENLLYTSELHPRRKREDGQLYFQDVPKQDHLVCFLGGLFMLGVTEGTGPVPPLESTFIEAQADDFYAGKGLIRGCMDTYASTRTGLAPEIANWFLDTKDAHETKRDWYVISRIEGSDVPPIDARNILRPELVESLFVAYRITGDRMYREWGWAIFKAFEKHCKLPAGGFASILDVDELPVRHEDRMETFWLSETLKYLYLLFSDADVLPLDKYVFNTEAHPLPVFTPGPASRCSLT
ncbi:mannosyl-oligosaccharide alpha-1,2-mannosidase [Microbotryomycetes sp. JL201]|nr:mannosyl-oligosaccharide alpha-1,2-mannosidase [Microbotryomycetes sp. JL201]